MRWSREIGRGLAIAVGLFIAGTAEIALLWRHPLLLAVLLLASGLGAIALLRKPFYLAVFLIGALLGPTAEIVGVWAGGWRYAHATPLGIPLWLPCAWGVAIVIVQATAHALALLFAPQAKLAADRDRPVERGHSNAVGDPESRGS